MRIVLTTCLLFNCLITFCQSKEEKVLELPGREGFVNTTIYPVGKRGFFLLTNEIVGKKSELSYYSTGLEKRNTISFERKAATTDLGVITDKDSVIFSFVESSFYTLFIKEFNAETGIFEKKEYDKRNQYFVPSESFLFRDKIIITGKVNKRAKILVLDPRTGKQEFLELPGSHPKDAIVAIQVDQVYDKLSILYRTKETPKITVLNLLAITADWEVSGPHVLSEDPRLVFNDKKINWTSDKSFVLAGTYSLEGGESTGFYFSKWNNYQQQLVRYHSFSKFHDYAHCLSAVEQRTIEQIRQDTTITDYIHGRILFHPVYLNGSGYRLIGEVYKPKFHYGTETVSNRDWVDWTAWLLTDSQLPAYEPITRSTQTFEGFLFSHAAIIDLDESGNKINDYCFELKPGMVSKNIKPLLQVTTSPGENLKMIHVQQPKEVFVREIVADSVRTSFSDRLAEDVDWTGKQTNNLQCVPWYENQYLVYGIEKLQSKTDLSRGVMGTPSIFFVKRVSYPSPTK